jgi:nucleoid-associated protein YgaU
MMRNDLLRRLGVLALVFTLFCVIGCGSKVARDAGVSDGDYYTVEEVGKLNKEQYAAYCAKLDAELASLEQGGASATSEASAVRSQLSSLNAELQRLEKEHNAGKGEVDALQKDIAWYEGLPKVYVVQKGDFLQKISGFENIYNDPTKWTRIYFANRDMLLEEGPNWIYPNWELTIPRDWPNRWTVRQDEYLGRIAGYWEIYDDATQWTRIYEANRDQVKDPDMIWPNWELTVPRD